MKIVKRVIEKLVRQLMINIDEMQFGFTSACGTNYKCHFRFERATKEIFWS